MNTTAAHTDPDPDATGDESSARRFVVGIGASAGGLEALSQLVAHLPRDLGIPCVVVQHSSPTYRSMLVQLLARETVLDVVEVVDGTIPLPNTIYVTPATHNVVLRGNALRLVALEEGVVPRPSINTLFASLAEAKGEDAIGVILSGTGSDGALGIRDIKAGGGLTFAQEPESAKYNGMPQSAIDTDCVDWILPPARVADEIAALVHTRGFVVPAQESVSLPLTLKKLLGQVRKRTRIDFSGYKDNTLMRRIERRMTANRLSSLDDYLAFAQGNTEELDRLCRDILISVTAFFRDPEAFRDLRVATATLIAPKAPGEEVRVWVPGCATGEEVYSIAIVLLEACRSAAKSLRLQIFATDIDINALAKARRGIYSSSAVSQIPAELLGRYFQKPGDRYEIAASVRDAVVFARQDLNQDPPFLRLDLISCRNVLIYFKNDLQARVLAMFHYALNPGGYLFLGRSEGISQQEGLYSVVDKESRLFRPRPQDKRLALLNGGRPSLARDILPRSDLTPPPLTPESEYRNEVLRHYGPPSVVVDEESRLLHVFGDVNNWMQVPDGAPSFDLAHLICRGLRSDLQTLLRQARKRQSSTLGRARSISAPGGQTLSTRLAVHPFVRDGRQLFLVAFEPAPAQPSKDSKRDAAPEEGFDSSLKTLEDELSATREHLQTVIEELETSNEELQALNEEVQASNEELQASNEELEAANEELQSTNEELATINQELQNKTQELSITNDDLENVLNNLGYPVLVVNNELTVLRYNLTAASIFNIAPGNAVLRLGQLQRPAGIDDFTLQVERSIAERRPVELALTSGAQHYSLRINPYGGPRAAGAGAVIVMVDTTAYSEAQLRLRQSEEKLLAIMNHSTALLSVKDVAGRFIFINRAFEAFFGVEAATVLGRTVHQALPADVAQQFWDKDMDVLRQQSPLETEDILVRDGKERCLLTVRFPLLGEDGLIYATCTQATDVTERKRSEQELMLAARVFEKAGEGIMVTDAQHVILTVNEAFTQITGHRAEEVIGLTPDVLASHGAASSWSEDVQRALAKSSSWQGEVVNHRKNGEAYPCWFTVSTVKNGQGETTNHVCLFSDISPLQKSQARNEYLATHDAMTGLPNRSLFIDRLTVAIANAERSQQRLAVLFADLDNFKTINDTLGHDVGDQVIRAVAERMRECLRIGDTVSRFGGDEFILLLHISSEEDIRQIATRIAAMLGDSIEVDGREIFTSSSIGISLYPNDGLDPTTLIKNADAAMYLAKEQGKNNFQFFCEELRRTAQERWEIETGLHRAFIEDQLFLEYQPQYSLADGRMVGAEALIRWRHPSWGVIAPQRFIPVAENCGLSDRVAEFVMSQAFERLRDWRSGFAMPCRLAVNLSPRQFQRSTFHAYLRRLMSAYRLESQTLTLEFTESFLMDDVEHTRLLLHELKAIGIRLSLDDFGTGYSSLKLLKRLPIDEIKIDRSFVEEVETVADSQSIVSTILAMARSLSIDVVAEGIETTAQLDFLRHHGCRYGQGFLFSRPLGLDRFVTLLQDTPPAD